MTDQRKKGNPDVIILGVGTCGEDLSLHLLNRGLEVVGIEANLVGGECPYWACLPSKTMLRAAKTLQEGRRIDEKSGEAKVKPDWGPVAERVRWITGSWDDSGAVERYGKHGGHLVKGHGKLISPNTVQVNDETFTAIRGIVIATGTEPIIPPIEGLNKVDYWTTHDVIEAEKLPESIIVVGGGASGCELGQVLGRFGVKVTIVEAEDQLLPREEPEIAAMLEKSFESEGITVITGKRVKKASSENGSVEVKLDEGSQLDAECLFIATGRKPDLTGIGLEAIGINENQAYLPVDEHMRVTDGIWAMGDVTGKTLLTHVALYQSNIVAADILGKEHPPATYHAIPRGTFTDPGVGSVGLTEAQARENGGNPAVIIKRLPYTFRGVVDGLEQGMLKLVFDREKGTMLGASAVAPNATDMLGLLNLAVHAEVPVEKLRTMMYAFPSYYSTVGEAIGAWGKGLTYALDPEYEGIEQVDQISDV